MVLGQASQRSSCFGLPLVSMTEAMRPQPQP